MIFKCNSIIEFLMIIITFFLSLTLHEVSHGYAAYFMGDNTAKYMGRLSLNPIKHIDWIGFLVMMVAGFGWAKPVPVNMNNFNNPKRGMALTALAGPVANIFVAFLCALFFTLFQVWHITFEYLYVFLQYMFYVNTMFAMFNFIPISPLDGSKILLAILPNNLYYKLMRYEQYGFIVLIILVNTPIFNTILSNGVNNLQNALVNLVRLLPL